MVRKLDLWPCVCGNFDAACFKHKLREFYIFVSPQYQGILLKAFSSPQYVIISMLPSWCLLGGNFFHALLYLLWITCEQSCTLKTFAPEIRD